MKLEHRIGLVDDYYLDKCLTMFRYFNKYFRWFIYLKMSRKTFENSGKNIRENIVKLNLEQNIKSLLYIHLVYICAEKTNF